MIFSRLKRENLSIGLPKETKAGEFRVALTPEACEHLVSKGHRVIVQEGAGTGAQYNDDAYCAAGCHVAATAEEVWAQQLVVKVKEPQPAEFSFLREDLHLFCYLHLAGEPEVTKALQHAKTTATAFETVVEGNQTPLLAPMSAIAGRLGIQLAARQLHKQQGGRGVLLGGVSHHPRGHVVVIGAGIAGFEAAKLAHGMGADVTVLDINAAKLRTLEKHLPRAKTLPSTRKIIQDLAPTADVMVGAVYVHGKKAPIVIGQEATAAMPHGSIVMDIAIDQGGCTWGSTLPNMVTTHDAPFKRTPEPSSRDLGAMATGKTVWHCAIPNMPAVAPRTASDLLSGAIMPYVHDLARQKPSKNLRTAMNTHRGELLIQL